MLSTGSVPQPAQKIGRGLIWGGPKYLTLGEQQYFCLAHRLAVSQSTKSLDILQILGGMSPCLPPGYEQDIKLVW